MTHETYRAIESHMLALMTDAAHDKEHIYRVLYTALDIAGTEPDTDLDVLTAAALLHDIGRQAQLDTPSLCHAEEGSKMAYAFLLDQGWEENRAAHVRDCVLTHRFRTNCRPATLEAKILFDADKLDVTGAIGIARTLMYGGEIGQALYQLDEDGAVLTGADTVPSFFREYNHKLRNIADTLYNPRAKALAQGRQAASDAFYDALLAEVSGCYREKDVLLRTVLGGS